MSQEETFDPRQFRDALGQFPTGVTVVTARGGNGEKLGMTVSSFNSVSLSPPLILWSIDKNSLSFDAFTSAASFAIHVLAADQSELSRRFANRGTDKFAGLANSVGLRGDPILDGYAACFECDTTATHDAGDHVIIIGRVLAFTTREKAPLIFHRGRYAEISDSLASHL